MMAGLRSRLESIEARLPRRGKVVIVQADVIGRGLPAVEALEPGVTRLNVPNVAGDPLPHLTPEQRSAIGPNDRLFAIEYVGDWRP